MRASEASRRGFTLLEVMAAFMIFAILYTVLAGVAAQGFRAEGENQRRLEASLLADSYLAPFLRPGALLDPREEIVEEDIFTVATRVISRTPAELGFDLQGDGDESDRAGEATDTGLFGTDGAAGASPLLEVEIRVAWSEGDREIELTRTTYAIDAIALEGAFPDTDTADAVSEDEPPDFEALLDELTEQGE